MEYTLSKKTQDILMNYNITFSKADISQIDDILNVYAERMKWFRENGIKQ